MAQVLARKYIDLSDLMAANLLRVDPEPNAERFPLQNIRVDDVIRKVAKHGASASMVKSDVEAVYRNIPVHPDDRFLLGLI